MLTRVEIASIRKIGGAGLGAEWLMNLLPPQEFYQEQSYPTGPRLGKQSPGWGRAHAVSVKQVGAFST
jgi:hypothetical protein